MSVVGTTLAALTQSPDLLDERPSRAKRLITAEPPYKKPDHQRSLAAHLTHHAATNRTPGAAAIIDDLTTLLDTFPTGPADDVALLSLSAASAPPPQRRPAHRALPAPAFPSPIPTVLDQEERPRSCWDCVWDPRCGLPERSVRRSTETKAPAR